MSMPTPHEPDAAALPRRVTVVAGSLHMARSRLDVAAASSRGISHAVNEDAHSTLDGPAPVYVVADGVGGGALASRASRELVACLHEALDDAPIDERTLRDALLDADRRIARSIADRTDRLGAATVAVCASTDAQLSAWWIAWVGDCRIYHLGADADHGARPITRDDSYRHLQEWPPAGGSLDDPARMVGNGAVAVPNIAQVSLQQGEMLLLCSDGVHRHARESDMSRLLHDDGAPLARRCGSLVALARLRGSRDDATALVVRRAGVVASVPRQTEANHDM